MATQSTITNVTDDEASTGVSTPQPDAIVTLPTYYPHRKEEDCPLYYDDEERTSSNHKFYTTSTNATANE